MNAHNSMVWAITWQQIKMSLISFSNNNYDDDMQLTIYNF